MKNFLQPVFSCLWNAVDRPLNFIEWLVTDHNGKPSTSRLLLWIWSGFCIWWITVEVHTTHTVSTNAVYLVIISLLGPSISIVMKGAAAKDFVAIITAIVTGNKRNSVATTMSRPLQKPCPKEEDGA